MTHPAAAARVLAAWTARPDRAVIFDFNGTLSDDEPILLEVFSEIFSGRLGRPLSAEEYYSRLRGRSDREIVEAVVDESAADGGRLVEELLQMRAERYLAKVAESSPVRPGTVALVARLAACGVPMAVVTGAQRVEVEYVLKDSPVGEHLTVVVTEEDVANGKPDPEGFLAGARLLGRAPADLLVFGDSVPGVQAALAAGMSCIAVAGSHPSAEVAAVAPAVVDRLGADLLDPASGV